MPQASRTPAESAAHFQAFLCAGIADLCRLVGAAGSADRRRAKGRITKVLGPGRIAECADLALYLLLVTRGLQPVHTGLYPHRDRLAKLLQRVYRLAVITWDQARQSDARTAARMLKDVAVLTPAGEALCRFAASNLGGLCDESLRDFGVDDVHGALVRLSEKMAVVITEKAPRAGTAAEGLLGGTLLIAATAGLPGGAGGHSRDTLVRAGARMALWEPASKTPAARQSLRRCVKRVGKLVGR
jgi:hypothetical protein